MSAAERIQTAIGKLEALQVDSSPGPWDGVVAVLSGDGWEAVAPGYPVHAELIETLHRTIDAQLAILRTSLTLNGLVPMDQALALADAILGGA